MFKVVFTFWILVGSAWAHQGESIYSVPVMEEALVPYATFSIPEARLRIRDGFARMDYKLPAILSGGEPIHVKMEAFSNGTEEKLHLTGKFGTMDCEVNFDLANCHVVYDRKTLLPLTQAGESKVQQYLKQTILEEAELALRQDVFAVFSHEAAGDCKNVVVRRDH